MSYSSLAVVCLTLVSLSAAPLDERQIPRGMFIVKPATSSNARPGANLTVGRGQFFSYAQPQGWRVGEEGQFALSLVASDNKAYTVMVGNAGLQPNYPPGRFVQEKLMAMRPEGLQIGQGRVAKPVAGFMQAYEFDVSYHLRGAWNRGVAKCNVNTAYDTAIYVMTAAISDASQWQGYSTWLPLVADQISATNGAAFGRRGIMAQNLQNSREYGEAAARYREWSQKNWQGVVDARGRSQDQNNAAFRENLGAVHTYVNPYDSRVPLELPQTYEHYWVDRQGNILGTNDGSINPNHGSTGEWRQMPRR